MCSQETEELQSLELGTKSYWDAAYQLEIENFESHGDVGEIWFGEDSAHRITRWLANSDLVSEEDAVIDLGCGNGMLLIELAEEGFKNLTGVDYSAQAIQLAKTVAQDRGYENINYMTCDIVSDNLDVGQFAVVLDKGTYDAISLNPDNAIAHRRAYKANLKKVLKPGGLLVIASCNWAEEELKQQFDSDFTCIATIPAPKFQFGGKVGSSVSTVVFKLR